MSKLKVMSREERKELMSHLESRFGLKEEIFRNYVFIRSGRKVWMTTPEVIDKNFSGFNVEVAGMLFARWEKRKEKIKLTTNAAQVFGKYAGKNVVEVNEEQLHQIICGLNIYDIDVDCEDGYVILRYGKHVLGIGLKQGRFIKNMIPKARRIKKL